MVSIISSLCAPLRNFVAKINWWIFVGALLAFFIAMCYVLV
jgi:hypothetical protein